jgi:predicted transcriptional regulator of viral defense system
MPNLDARIAELFETSPVKRSRDLTAAGIPRIALSRALASGQLKRLARGIYSLADYQQSEHGILALVSQKVPGAIICLLSALRIHELTTQAPHEIWIALPNKAWIPKLEYPELRLTRFGEASFNYGVMMKLIDGQQVRITTIEKTIADCFKFRNKVGLDVALEALKDAGASRRLDRDELWNCAKVNRITRVIRPYMEALA